MGFFAAGSPDVLFWYPRPTRVYCFDPPVPNPALAAYVEYNMRRTCPRARRGRSGWNDAAASLSPINCIGRRQKSDQPGDIFVAAAMHNIDIVGGVADALCNRGHPTNQDELDSCISEGDENRFGHSVLQRLLVANGPARPRGRFGGGVRPRRARA